MDTKQSFGRSEHIEQLSAALRQAQAEYAKVEKKLYNEFHKTYYADLGTIVEATRPALSKYGLTIIQLTISDADKIGVHTELVHDNGQFIWSDVFVDYEKESGKSKIQVVGSTFLYLRRYGYSAICGVYTETDDDGNAALRNQQARNQARNQAPRPTQPNNAPRPNQAPTNSPKPAPTTNPALPKTDRPRTTTFHTDHIAFQQRAIELGVAGAEVGVDLLKMISTLGYADVNDENKKVVMAKLVERYGKKTTEAKQ